MSARTGVAPVVDHCGTVQVQTHLISPLSASVTELSRQKEELVSIIKRKDREIQDYRESGATVTRRESSLSYRSP